VRSLSPCAVRVIFGGGDLHLMRKVFAAGRAGAVVDARQHGYRESYEARMKTRREIDMEADNSMMTLTANACFPWCTGGAVRCPKSPQTAPNVMELTVPTAEVVKTESGRLKILRPQGCAGSTPASGTIFNSAVSTWRVETAKLN